MGCRAPATPDLDCEDNQLAASLPPELRVRAAFALLSLGEGQARLGVSAGAGAAVTLDGTHQRDINGHLRAMEGIFASEIGFELPRLKILVREVH